MTVSDITRALHRLLLVLVAVVVAVGIASPAQATPPLDRDSTILVATGSQSVYGYDVALNSSEWTFVLGDGRTAGWAPLEASLAKSTGVLAAFRPFFVAADTAGDGTAVIGKVKDLGSVGDNEYTLLDRLPDQGSPAANWKQNSGVLRQVMSRGTPIRDASVDPATGALNLYPGSFLNAERNLLQSKGWTYDPKTTLWSPGG